MPLKIAVIIPCYNEEVAIAQTVKDFAAALPEAKIYVYDNNSKDRTIEVARAAGAIVRSEHQQGKGNVVRRMLADVDADVYVLTDGDATYDAAAARDMIALLVNEELDMVVGSRKHTSDLAYRSGHQFGNKMLTTLLAQMFGNTFKDILSGYRIFSRRYAKSFPALTSGFEIETEMSVHSLELKMPVSEYETKYSERPEGSVSKLSTYRDGWRILMTMIKLYRVERPMLFFGMLAILLFILSIVLAIPLGITYFETGLVPRLPTAVLVTGLTILAGLCVFAGLILDTVVHGRREVRRLAYLSHRAPHQD
ncbi:glycosyltransferase family 2 protein [Duganella levis]|uniref:Glycosyltransferase n=1 Tax=Duganella levis TaxID=2692169 RepID=A0ABW9W548_9BURK|nr:glycosyltransferase family 2 protein [Duganella levis]MYN29076.1 glycosyltransferase [Duganella levis]